jgi:hypothetical protein
MPAVAEAPLEIAPIPSNLITFGHYGLFCNSAADKFVYGAFFASR